MKCNTPFLGTTLVSLLSYTRGMKEMLGPPVSRQRDARTPRTTISQTSYPKVAYSPNMCRAQMQQILHPQPNGRYINYVGDSTKHHGNKQPMFIHHRTGTNRIERNDAVLQLMPMHDLATERKNGKRKRLDDVDVELSLGGKKRLHHGATSADENQKVNDILQSLPWYAKHDHNIWKLQKDNGLSVFPHSILPDLLPLVSTLPNCSDSLYIPFGFHPMPRENEHLYLNFKVGQHLRILQLSNLGSGLIEKEPNITHIFEAWLLYNVSVLYPIQKVEGSNNAPPVDTPVHHEDLTTLRLRTTSA